MLGLVRVPDLAVAPFMWGLMGFYGGSMFGALMSVIEGSRTLQNLRIGRVAVWGALAGFALPVVYNLMRGDPGAISMVSLVTNALILAPLSAGSAAGMTVVAQRAARDELASGDDSPVLEGDGEVEKLLAQSQQE